MNPPATEPLNKTLDRMSATNLGEAYPSFFKALSAASIDAAVKHAEERESKTAIVLSHVDLFPRRGGGDTDTQDGALVEQLFDRLGIKKAPQTDRGVSIKNAHELADFVARAPADISRVEVERVDMIPKVTETTGYPHLVVHEGQTVGVVLGTSIDGVRLFASGPGLTERHGYVNFSILIDGVTEG